MVTFRKRLSREETESIKTSMQSIVARTPRVGTASRLFTGQDVEKAIKSPLENLTHSTSKTIDQKIDVSVRSMERRVNATLVKALDKFEEKILLAIAGIKQPENGKPGHTPTQEEMAGVVSKVLNGLSKPETGLSLSKEEDKNALVALIRAEAEAIVKKKPTQLGGGGTTYAFHLKDMPSRSKGAGPYYAGNEGKPVVVSADGKSFTFGETSSSGMTPLAAAETPNGVLTEFTFDEAPVIIATEFGFFIEDATHGFTLTGTVATLPIAPSNFIKGYK